ncbi:hypothetical protein Leryth_017547, partial [Lithospermum erythrorhizon]
MAVRHGTCYQSQVSLSMAAWCPYGKEIGAWIIRHMVSGNRAAAFRVFSKIANEIRPQISVNDISPTTSHYTTASQIKLLIERHNNTLWENKRQKKRVTVQQRLGNHRKDLQEMQGGG